VYAGRPAPAPAPSLALPPARPGASRSVTRWVGGTTAFLAMLVGTAVALYLTGGNDRPGDSAGRTPPAAVGPTPERLAAEVLTEVVQERKWDRRHIVELSRTPPSPLQKAAAADLTMGDSDNPAERAALGDVWADASGEPALTPQTRAAVAVRAAFHYQFGIDDAPGRSPQATSAVVGTYYGPPDVSDRTPAYTLPAPVTLTTPFGDQGVWQKLGTVRVPCVVEVVGMVPEDGVGDGWLCFRPKDRSDSGAAVQVASSAGRQPIRVARLQVESPGLVSNPIVFPRRRLRRAGVGNTVVWAVNQVPGGGVSSEVYLNGTFAGVAPVGEWKGADAVYELGLWASTPEVGVVRGSVRFERVRVWAGAMKPLPERVADLVEQGVFPAK
jgi:hypothetical protein